MASYTGFKSVLDATLGDYCLKGFRLEEDDDFLYLYHGDNRIVVFSSKSATIESVLRACQQYEEATVAPSVAESLCYYCSEPINQVGEEDKCVRVELASRRVVDAHKDCHEMHWNGFVEMVESRLWQRERVN